MTRSAPASVSIQTSSHSSPAPPPWFGEVALRRLLMVLDNCEHLMLACAQLAEALLGACPEDGAALELGQPWLASRAGLAAETVEPALIEGMQPVAHGLRVATQFAGDLARAQAVPTARDHLGVDDPVGRGMVALRQLANLALFIGVER